MDRIQESWQDPVEMRTTMGTSTTSLVTRGLISICESGKSLRIGATGPPINRRSIRLSRWVKIGTSSSTWLKLSSQWSTEWFGESVSVLYCSWSLTKLPTWMSPKLDSNDILNRLIQSLNLRFHSLFVPDSVASSGVPGRRFLGVKSRFHRKIHAVFAVGLSPVGGRWNPVDYQPCHGPWTVTDGNC